MEPSPLQKMRLVGVSLKMYFDLTRTAEYIDAVAALAPQADAAGVGLFILPDFVALASANSKLSATNVLIGAQDCHYEDQGAFTGEVSPKTLSEIGVRLVALGHAERRRLFGETDEDVARKAAAAVRNGIVPLVCIGERTAPSSIGPAQAVPAAVRECEPQVTSALSLLPNHGDVIFAYEPVWAIGAAQPAEPDHVVAVVKQLRDLTTSHKGSIHFLYGGSAGPGTFARMKTAVDGLFLGRFGHVTNNLRTVIEEVGQK